jgi:uncharacterized protein YuzE
MKLQISYYPSDDILLLENDKPWKYCADMAESVLTYADTEKNPAAIEISGAKRVLEPLLRIGQIEAERKVGATSGHRLDEGEVDRSSLPLTVIYDKDTDTLTLASGLPTTFDFAIADGLIAYFDGEDELGKFVNGIKLENAAKLLKPYLAP